MLQHYLSTSVRHFRRNKLTTGINVVCLAIGFACFLGAHWMVRSSAASDTHFEDAGRIVIITQRNLSPNAQGLFQQPVTSFIAGEHLRAEFRDLPIARASDGTETGESLTPFASGDAKAFVHVRYADPEFLDVFSFEFTAGEPRTAFARPRSVILTQSTAEQMFGGAAQALGRPIVIRNRYDVTVTGVIADVLHPSHMAKDETYQFDALVSMDVYVARGAHDARRQAALERWGFTDVITYARLPAGLSVESFNVRLADFGARRVPAEQGAQLVFQARALSGIGMDAALGGGEDATSLGTLLYFLGVLVLLISAVNYANLATAVAATRAQEVGLRRVVGAGRWQLLSQYLFESALLSTVALLLASLFVAGALLAMGPDGLVFAARAALAGSEFWMILGGVWIAVTIVAGAYPAIVLANVRPIVAVRGGHMRRGNRLAAALVCVQFVAASFLLTVVLMMARQNSLLMAEALDGLGSPVVVLRSNVNDAAVPYERLRAELLRQPHVESVTGSQRTPWSTGASIARVATTADRAAPGHVLNLELVNYDYFETLGLELAAGRVFGRQYANDEPPPEGMSRVRNVVIDREAARMLGFATAEDAVGKTVYTDGQISRQPNTVVGVVEQRALSLAAPASIFFLNPPLAVIPTVRIAGGSVREALGEIDTVWNTLVPNMPLQRQFADEVWTQTYESFAILTRIVAILSALACATALLGLIGVSTHVIERRRREIGVRKTLGASVPRVLSLLIRESSGPVVVGNLIALPFAVVAAQAFLAMFTARASGSPVPYALSFLLTIAVAWLAVIAQATRAARVKPAEVLRYE